MDRRVQVVGLLALHELLRHIQKDPDAFVIRNLPRSVQVWLREHIKTPADRLLDAVLCALCPMVVPKHLRSLCSTVVSYGTESTQVLSLFRPTNGTQTAPVLVFVHGGVWSMGHRAQYDAIGQRLAHEGFVAIIVGYATWPQAGASAQSRDVALATTFVTSHADELGVDASRVFLSGQSSGAHVAALALLSGACCTGFFGICGIYDLAEHYEHERRRGYETISMMGVAAAPLASHSPTLMVGPDRLLGCDRVLLAHGELDITVPLSNSALFAMALQKAGQRFVKLVALPHDDHFSFLLDLGRGRPSELLDHLKEFCGLRVARL